MLQRIDKSLVIVFFLAFLLHGFVATRPTEYLFNKNFIFDDTFYPLSIARNIARGEGSTMDGIHLTNAYQPLLTVLSIPLFYFFPHDPFVPFRIIFYFLAIINLFVGYLIYRLIFLFSHERRYALLGAAVWLLNLPIISYVVNGLETALVIFFFLLTLLLYLKQRLENGAFPNIRNCIIFGLLIGIGILARIDTLFLLGAVFIDLFWRYWQKKDISFRSFIVRCFIFLGSAFLIASPWFIYNFFVFGHFLPRAVAGYRVLIPFLMGVNPNEIPLSFYGFTFWQSLKLLFFVTPFWGFMRIIGFSPDMTKEIVSFAVIVVAGIFIIGFFWRNLSSEIRKRCLPFLTIFGLYALVMVFSYSFLVLATFFLPRYYTPILAGIVIAASILAGPIFFRTSVVFRNIVLLCIIGIGLSYPYFSNARLGYPFHEKISIIDTIIPEDARIGIFQAGALSYFSKRTIINIDGKLNPSILPYYAKNKLYQYFIDENIAYIGDTKNMFNDVFFSLLGIDDPQSYFSAVYDEGDYIIYRLK